MDINLTVKCLSHSDDESRRLTLVSVENGSLTIGLVFRAIWNSEHQL